MFAAVSLPELLTHLSAAEQKASSCLLARLEGSLTVKRTCPICLASSHSGLSYVHNHGVKDSVGLLPRDLIKFTLTRNACRPKLSKQGLLSVGHQ